MRLADRGLLALMVAVLATAHWLPAAEWRRVLASETLSFPADNGAHPDFRTEWWYATMILRADDGRAFGVQVTIFRQGLDPTPAAPGASALRARQVLAGHLAIIDLASSGPPRLVQRLRRVAAGLAAASPDHLDVFLDDFGMRQGRSGTIEVRAGDEGTGIEFAVDLVPLRGVIRHGLDGLSVKGPQPGNASVYLSNTRLAATGRLRIDGTERRVQGEGWFDHEWGSSQLGQGVSGWDWFGLRLGDGRELMLYLLRAPGGPVSASSGTLVERDGRTRHLSLDDFRVTPTGTWPSPHSGARYPARWRIEVPAARITLDVVPFAADAELDARASTGAVYWEGPVLIEGAPGGEGYVELTGYAAPFALRF